MYPTGEVTVMIHITHRLTDKYMPCPRTLLAPTVSSRPPPRYRPGPRTPRMLRSSRA